jgi:outer membrane protein OmpA-like peptidoglycan-associated protein
MRCGYPINSIPVTNIFYEPAVLCLVVIPLETGLPTKPLTTYPKLWSRHRFAWLLAFVISFLLLTGCGSPKPFLPQNVGREYGNPKLPLVVSHLPEKNQWTLSRVKHRHHIFNKTLCFNYICRRMIGRSKVLLTTSKKEFIKVIKRNAERGFFDNIKPAVPAQKPVGTDSIQAPADTVTVAPAPGAPAPEALILKADSLITLNEFLFETNSYKLRKEHLRELDVLSTYLLAHPTLFVDISGHTDNTGDERHNVTLSARRAESVAEYLVSKGVDYDQVVFKGLGSALPVASNDSADGRGKNRRVEILIRNP